MKTCETCRFWHQWNDDMGGSCHRYPPFHPAHLRVIKGAVQYYVDVDHSHATDDAFPKTHARTWCGEWKKGSRHE